MGRKRRATARWRRRFLAALARTANARLSAATAGVDASTAYDLRKRDARFAADWRRALLWGRARAKAAGRPVYAGGRARAAGNVEALDPRPMVPRRLKGGGTQMVRGGEGRWTQESADTFFMWLLRGFGVRRACREAGFSTVALYNRRKLDPEFAARWDLAKAEGLARNDMLLIDAVPLALDPEVIEAAEGLPTPSIAEAIRIQALYLRRPDGPGRGRGRWLPVEDVPIDKLREDVLARLEAMRGHGKRGSGEAGPGEAA